MSRTLLIYPYESETSDILRIEKFSRQYEKIRLCSFLGSGLEGKDAGKADGGGFIGITVEDNFEEILKEVSDVLFSSYHNIEVKEDDILEKIKYSLKCGKNVLMSKELRKKYSYWCGENALCEDDELGWIKDSEKGKIEKLFKIGKELDYNTLLISEGLVDIVTPVIGVAGTSENTCKFALQVQMVAGLREKGYKVSWIASNWLCELLEGHELPLFMKEEQLNDTEKIILFNRYVKYIEESEEPDVLIIAVPGGIMPCNKNLTGDFGVLAYKVFQAVSPDIMCLAVFYDEYQKKFFEEIENCIKYRYSTKLSIISFCNRRIDWDEAKVVNTNIIPYYTINEQIVEHLVSTMQQCTNIELINLRDKEIVNKITQRVIRELEDDEEYIVF